MDLETQITVTMLRALIDSMEATAVEVLYRFGDLNGDTATITMVLRGAPLPIALNNLRR